MSGSLGLAGGKASAGGSSDATGDQKAYKTLTTITEAQGVEHSILRDNMPFGRPGQAEFGTNFGRLTRRAIQPGRCCAAGGHRAAGSSLGGGAAIRISPNVAAAMAAPGW